MKISKIDEIQYKVDESKFLKRTSDHYFFELFNKIEKKCPLKIPDTIFIGGTTVTNWYFTSSKT